MSEIYQSLQLIHSLSKNKNAQDLLNILEFISCIYITKLDLILALEQIKYESEEFRVKFHCRVISIICITFLDESKNLLNKNFRNEMLLLNLYDDLKTIDSTFSSLSKFNTENRQIYRTIRNLSIAHKTNGVFPAIECILNINTNELLSKTIHFVKILESFDQSINIILQKTLSHVKAKGGHTTKSMTGFGTCESYPNLDQRAELNCVLSSIFR